MDYYVHTGALRHTARHVTHDAWEWVLILTYVIKNIVMQEKGRRRYHYRLWDECLGEHMMVKSK